MMQTGKKSKQFWLKPVHKIQLQDSATQKPVHILHGNTSGKPNSINNGAYSSLFDLNATYLERQLVHRHSLYRA